MVNRVLLIATLIVSLASCSRVEKKQAEEKKGDEEQIVQKTFASPDDAGTALLEAAKAGDKNALLAIFGRDGEEVLFTGDSTKDQGNLRDFAAAYQQMHRWSRIQAGGEVLQVGADNFVFPIPLDKNSSGQWVFDTGAGKDEILARRIGRGERGAIAGVLALTDAQRKYFTSTKQYAQTFASEPGKQNGLYWQAEGEATSPLGQFPDMAKALTSPESQPFNGYYYRILTQQGTTAKGGAKDYVTGGKMTGGFAILAYPAEYRNSGIMSFIVGPSGVVYEKDMGEGTADAARAVTEYDPGDGWKPAVPGQTTALPVG
jgi:hypothetical protein